MEGSTSVMERLLAGSGEEGENFGVHIAYSDLYNAIIFLASIYAGGILSAKFLSMPSLVGEIFVGVLFGQDVCKWSFQCVLGCLCSFAPAVELFLVPLNSAHFRFFSITCSDARSVRHAWRDRVS